MAIQAHDPKSVFYFKRIRIREFSSDADVFSANKADAEEFFRDKVTPFVKTYCIDCHQNRRPTEAGVNFSPALKDPGHAAFSHQWRKAAARVRAHDMPPEEMEQPSDEERAMFGEWLEKVKFLSPKDPGPFVIRRLTKAEYGNTLHDLFGVDPAIADALPEEVSGEGYLNSLSPLQMEQYLSIAEELLDKILAPAGEPPTAIQKRLLGDPPLTEVAGPRVGARSCPVIGAKSLPSSAVQSRGRGTSGCFRSRQTKRPRVSGCNSSDAQGGARFSPVPLHHSDQADNR